MADPADELRHQSVQTGRLATVVVTTDGTVAMINSAAEVLFGASAGDVGRPFRDLDLSSRPVELCHVLEQALLHRWPMRVSDVRPATGAGPGCHLDIEVTPLVAADSRLLGVSVVFTDVSRSHRLQAGLEQANRQLNTAYEELRSTHEELETTCEELRSTVEQLDVAQCLLQDRSGELDTVLTRLRAAVGLPLDELRPTILRALDAGVRGRS